MFLQTIDKKGLKRFFRYSFVGVGTFLLDLCLLYSLTTYVHVAYYIATPVAFLIGVSINYCISRQIVFQKTSRTWRGGYTHFIGIALVGMVVTTGSVVLLVQYAVLNYLGARILVACVIGLFNYLLNLHWNFKVAGLH